MTRPTTRRRMIRGGAATTLMAAAMTGAMMTPASAASSQHYGSLVQCRNAQTATGASSFVRITRSCYQHPYQAVGGVWVLDTYRFDYVTRSN